jgi:RNA polymerase sigma-B factor
MSFPTTACGPAPRRSDGETLVRRYHATGDRRLRQRAVGEYMPLARKLARRYHRGREPLEDLEQVAYLGLVKAVDRFDPRHGARFSSFAMPTITGELRRHFRDTGWAVHVPRAMQEATLELTKAAAALTELHGRAPTTGELARATGLDAEVVAEALHARGAQETWSLDRPIDVGSPDERTLGDAIGADDDAYDLVDHRVTVAPLLRRLPPREREVLQMRFSEDLTQTQIATRVGCSQMQVSRILRRAIATLSQVSDEPQPLPGRDRSALRRRAGDDG